MPDCPSSHNLPKGRELLARVVGGSPDIITVAAAADLLNVSPALAAKKLSRWVSQGWLRRVGPGSYVPVPIELLLNETVLEDPWILVPALYSPAYIGGRTAAEYWDLTEQIFTDIQVMTSRPVRTKQVEHHGVRFTLKHVREERLFGLRPVWRQRSRVMVSDVARTIVDLLDDPLSGGGIEHVADCLHAYLVHPDRDDGALVEYGDRMKNGVIFKRLGFLLEGSDGGAELVDAAMKRRTKGVSKLDPGASCPRLVTRWGLMVPEHKAAPEKR